MNTFEWDENKRKINLDKHEIDFLDALEIFYDPDRIEYATIRSKEKRYQTIGIVHEIVLFLVYTIREEKKRIISVRRASKDERQIYYEEKTKR